MGLAWPALPFLAFISHLARITPHSSFDSRESFLTDFEWTLNWLLYFAVALTLLRDAAQWVCLRGVRGIGVVVLGCLKDVLMIGVWLGAPFVRTVGWRGHRLRISAGTRIYALPS